MKRSAGSSVAFTRPRSNAPSLNKRVRPGPICGMAMEWNPWSVSNGPEWHDAQFARLCKVLGRNDLADAPRFGANAGRVEARDVLAPELERAVSAWARDDLLTALAAARVPAGPINDVREALADRQVRHRGMVLDMDGVPGVAMPVRFDGATTGAPTPSPRLGEHDDEVFSDPNWI